MKTLSLLAAILTLGFTLAVGDAEAASKRLGGGQSSGMQRQATSPAQSPGATPSANKAQAAAAAPQAQPKRSWMGPLAGLAAGLGLAALASHFGFGEGLANMMMIGLLVMAAVFVIGYFMRRRAAAQQPAGGLQYAANGVGSAAAKPASYDMSLPASASASTVAPTVAPASGAPAGHIPADFDVEGFQRNAKVNFIRLQAANDAGNLDDIREFTTPEMFAEIKLAIAERGSAAQQTDVVGIDAQVTDVAEEASRYIVSVRFVGSIREEKNAPPEPVDEIWNLVKSRDGKGGWLLAGIQQM
ncbi:MAG: Tim44 domain-containing protein [Betaproteobacteria bacterium]|nr:Tim44 domain-containing protein [Betaproteobacteria bacterium]